LRLTPAAAWRRRIDRPTLPDTAPAAEQTRQEWRRGSASSQQRHPRRPDLLAERYLSASLAEIAEQIGVSTSTVRRVLIRHGIERLPRSRNRRPPLEATQRCGVD
jgi:DNA-directed RNA polymerase specialized sigma24 family protein